MLTLLLDLILDSGYGLVNQLYRDLQSLTYDSGLKTLIKVKFLDQVLLGQSLNLSTFEEVWL
jgi:hypothetical protein